MALFDFLKLPDINIGLQEYYASENAVLLDVRSNNEFAKRHIPDAVNIPLENIKQAENLIMDKSLSVFVYCYTGRRSRQAVSTLKQMGFVNVKNIGGIISYKG